MADMHRESLLMSQTGIRGKNIRCGMEPQYLQLVLCVGLMLAVSVKTGALACAAAGLTYAYYRQKSYREFGGITGDLAGYFVTLCEGVMAVLVAAAGLIG